MWLYVHVQLKGEGKFYYAIASWLYYNIASYTFRPTLFISVLFVAQFYGW